MLITRGESVQRNTSAEGVPAVQKQIQELKDSWDALLSASIQCKRWVSPESEIQMASRATNINSVVCQICSQLEGSLSQWTSYQEDVHQFVVWVERVEESLDPSDKLCPEMRDKTANLSKAKVLNSVIHAFLSRELLIQVKSIFSQ